MRIITDARFLPPVEEYDRKCKDDGKEDDEGKSRDADPGSSGGAGGGEDTQGPFAFSLVLREFTNSVRLLPSSPRTNPIRTLHP